MSETQDSRKITNEIETDLVCPRSMECEREGEDVQRRFPPVSYSGQLREVDPVEAERRVRDY